MTEEDRNLLLELLQLGHIERLIPTGIDQDLDAAIQL